MKKIILILLILCSICNADLITKDYTLRSNLKNSLPAGETAVNSYLLEGYDANHFQIAGSYLTLASLSGTTPIDYNNVTGNIRLTTPLSVANGGTGLATLAANRIPYATALDTIGSSANLTFDGSALIVSGSGQFNNIGIGIAPSTVNAATVNFLASGTTVKGISLSVVNTKNTAGTSLCTGVDFQSIFKPIFTSTQFARTISSLHGGSGIAQIAVNTGGTANVTGTNVRAFYGQVTAYDADASGGVANITTGATFYSVAATKGSGVITNLYSFYDAGQTVATNNWGIAINTANNYFNGSVRIGSQVAPTVPLDVTGAALISSTLGITGLTTATGGVTIGASGNIAKDINDLTITCAADKTVVFNPVVYDDLRITPAGFDRAGVADPALVSYTPSGSGIATYLYEFQVDDIAYFTAQMPHSYKQGENITVHVHWTAGTKGTTENTRTVGWKVDYSWANIDGTFSAMATADLSDATDNADHKHQMTPSGTLTGSSKNISSMLICNIKRTDTGTDDTWAGTASGSLPMILEIDFHYPIDTVGSRTATSK